MIVRPWIGRVNATSEPCCVTGQDFKVDGFQYQQYAGVRDAHHIRRPYRRRQRRRPWVRSLYAETFSGLGARVFGCDLSVEELAETARAGVTTAVVDLTNRAAATAWIAEIERTTGGAIDVLVNNAGGVAGQEPRPIEDVPDAEWDRIFAVNVGAAMALRGRSPQA